ncbi:MAG: 3D domain-containing protein [Planctomycetota bacterium]
MKIIKLIPAILVGVLIFICVGLWIDNYQMKHPKQDRSLFLAEVTAYCPCEKCCGNFADGVTASGVVISEGCKLVAASSKYPFGTKMKIPGYGVAAVQDRGGSLKGNRLDVLFHSHAEALKWGRRQLIIQRLETK